MLGIGAACRLKWTGLGSIVDEFGLDCRINSFNVRQIYCY